MKTNKKKDNVLNIFSIVAIVMSVVALCLGFLVVQFDGYFELERVKRVNISDIEDIVKLGETIYNDECILVEDIHISDSTFKIGTGEHPFSGTFNGNGHTIYFDFDTANQDCSLFNCIGATGVVKNTRFVFGNIDVEGNVFGGVAKINYGTVKDCKIECANIKIDSAQGIYSPCVIANKGTIINTVVNCLFSNTDIQSNESAILFGAACVYNYGVVRNCIAAPSFENFNCVDEFYIFIGERKNVGIGAVCAVTNIGAITESSVAVLQAGVYTSDIRNGLTVVDQFSAITTNSALFNGLNFDNHVWEVVSNELELIME